MRTPALREHPGDAMANQFPPPQQAAATLPGVPALPACDGNKIAGVRLPELSVTLGSYTGWHHRHP